jgi:hypothetical protein
MLLRIQKHRLLSKRPILKALKHTILALRLTLSKGLSIPLLRALDTLPLGLAAKDTEELRIETLVVVVGLGPAAQTLVRHLEEMEMLERKRRLVDCLGVKLLNWGLAVGTLDVDAFLCEEGGGGVEFVIVVIVDAAALLVGDETENVFVDTNGLLEVLSCKTRCLGVLLVR